MQQLLDIVALLLAKALVGLMYFLPRPVAMGIAHLCVSCFRVVNPRITRVARRNLELVFAERTPQEREQILKESFRVHAANLVGFAEIPRLTQDNIFELCDFSGVVEMAAELRRNVPGKGTLFLVPHLGCFELFSQMWCIANRPVATLVRPFDLPRLNAWWNARRELHGMEIFSRSGGYKEVLHRLSSGQDVSLMFDQNVKANHAIFVDLFGIPAATTKTVAFVALRTGCTIAFGTMVEVSPWKFKVIYQPIDNPIDEQGSYEDKALRLTRRVHECLESVVRQYPAQWFWIHRRFKTRPPGEPENIYAV